MAVYKGRVASGAKQGAYFVSIYKDRIQSHAGFHPFPGTLNVELTHVPDLPMRALFISSWTKGGKHFGAAWMYPASFLGTKGFVIVPELSRHGKRTIELISPYCLKTKFGLHDGDFMDVEIHKVE